MAVSMKVEVLRVAPFIGSLKVAVTVEETETPVAGGVVLAGVTEVTCGATAAMVVKLHVNGMPS